MVILRTPKRGHLVKLNFAFSGKLYQSSFDSDRMETDLQKIALVKNAIGCYPDFPKPGILFRDIFGILSDVVATRALLDLLVDHTRSLAVDVIVGLDARGFILGPLIAAELSKPFVPVRKKGKLPGQVISQSYKLEYGEDTLEVQRNNPSTGKRVLIVDDLLATGGTMEAAIQLLKSADAGVIHCLVVMELTSLNGRAKLSAPVHSLLQFD
ncbi:adenine phosphoribosyltransferase isoform X2 [Athalia rosae]|uniref:adenine phosphoribosyltransferase isoform X2 n=1 Tax=Athalia rosae TaxID=37344 RepID=UPI00062636BC|nr:adenine phosphoribosyltransferase isoform X2 [Athalia rosae]